MWFSVPVRHREMDDKFWRKNYFNNPTHLISKLRLLGTFSQKKLEKKFPKKRWKLVPIALVLKRRNLWKSKAILWKSKTVDKVTPETSNRTYCKIRTFPYLFVDMRISVLNKCRFLVIKNVHSLFRYRVTNHAYLTWMFFYAIMEDNQKQRARR